MSYLEALMGKLVKAVESKIESKIEAEKRKVDISKYLKTPIRITIQESDYEVDEDENFEDEVDENDDEKTIEIEQSPDKHSIESNVEHIKHTEHTEYLEHLKNMEMKYVVSPEYMKKQSEISEKMRAILVDWLIDVCLKFKMLEKTLFFCVHLIDRFLEIQSVARNKLQLVGVACLMISAKYNEIRHPPVKDYEFICAYAYSKKQILQMESIILNKLGFRLHSNTMYDFFDYCEIVDSQKHKKVLQLLNYSLLQLETLKYPPSLFVSYVIYFVENKNWSKELEYKTGYSEKDFETPLFDIEKFKKSNETLKVIDKKFKITL